ncbi:hypothetical protein QQS21_007351 [Conoideocrella luteorostrata]|uniref:Guanine nucleotide-exchange factor SEC12 n=1 Tax=Conoideocrella luteorostrata TaxID=1105319 RepID=A0AAJ0CNB8_9HYPO|nr:hypothetical protein QQS21_007351 [Conoideocrella luteorostrata]
MAPAISRANIEVDYPIYAVDFDPEDANRLVVGGGGGEGRSGVGNKMTILDASHQEELRIAGEIELSRDEDSVSSLAVGSHKGKITHVFAGINSSAADIAKGTNQHLRILAAEPSRAKPLSSSATSTPTKPRAFPESKIAEISRTSLFADTDPYMYQRLLRVSGPIGAAGSALGKDPQVAVFDTTVPKPTVRGVLELAKEAEGLDIIQTGANEFQLAYCDKHALYTVNIGSKTNSEPELVFSMPDDHGERPQFRSIRYLTPEFILAVANLPKKNTGALIQGLRLPSPGHEKARLAVTARIPGRVSATALAVANLSPPATATDPVGNTQFAIAVSGNNSSIWLYTLKHEVSSVLNLLLKLNPFHTLKSVHGQEPISGLAFSTFVTPKTHIRAQHVKLASTSLQKTVAVHNIPLKKYVDTTESRNKGPPRPARYVVAMRSRSATPLPLIWTLAVIVLMLAMVSQSVTEMYGVTKPVIFAQRFLPSWHGSLRHPNHQPTYFFENKLASLAGDKVLKAGEQLVLLEPVLPEGGNGDQKGLHVDVHDSDAHGTARTWDQLHADEQHVWKEKLRDAGAWTQNMGENVFKGVLFGELAGMVGRAVAG